jgi:hypothetical protein
MSNPETLTIRFEVYPGDVTEQYYPPTPNPGIEDVVQAINESGTWTVSSEVEDHTFTGQPAQNKDQAILNYLQARLDLPAFSATRGEGINEK